MVLIKLCNKFVDLTEKAEGNKMIEGGTNSKTWKIEIKRYASKAYVTQLMHDKGMTESTF